MNKVTFVPATSAHYCEEGQALPFRMALCKRVDDDVVGLCDFFKCRDFVAEALFSEQIDKPLSIYSFGWGPHFKEKPLTSDPSLHIAIKGDLDTFQENLPRLWEFENACNLELTEVLETNDPEVVVLQASAGWRKSVTLLNLYSLIIKSLMFKLPTKVGRLADTIDDIIISSNPDYSREKEYWQQITQTEGTAGLFKLVGERDSIFDINWVDFKDTNTSTLHHGHGPVAFFTAVKWVREGDDPACCEVIKPSVVKFCSYE